MHLNWFRLSKLLIFVQGWTHSSCYRQSLAMAKARTMTSLATTKAPSCESWPLLSPKSIWPCWPTSWRTNRSANGARRRRTLHVPWKMSNSTCWMARSLTPTWKVGLHPDRLMQLTVLINAWFFLSLYPGVNDVGVTPALRRRRERAERQRSLLREQEEASTRVSPSQMDDQGDDSGSFARKSGNAQVKY